jgi:hypothetical protein
MTTTYRLPSPFHEVEITLGPISVDPDALTAVHDGIWADERSSVYRFGPTTVAVHAVDRVEIDAAPGLHPDVVEAMLYGFVIRSLFRNAGVFSLHASLVQFGAESTGRAIGVAGASGAGKSTTMSYTAARHGGHVRVDDVLPVTVVDGVAMAHPFARPVHLTAEAAERLGLDSSRMSDDTELGLGKLAVDLAAADGPVPIQHLVMLRLAEPDAAEPLVIRPLRGAERLRHIVRHSNASGLSSFGSRADAYLDWATQLATAVSMTEVIRRPGDDTLDEVARHIASLALV